MKITNVFLGIIAVVLVAFAFKNLGLVSVANAKPIGMKDYVIIDRKTPFMLTQDVTSKMNMEGYQVQGGIMIATINGETHYFQALSK